MFCSFNVNGYLSYLGSKDFTCNVKGSTHSREIALLNSMLKDYNVCSVFAKDFVVHLDFLIGQDKVIDLRVAGTETTTYYSAQT